MYKNLIRLTFAFFVSLPLIARPPETEKEIEQTKQAMMIELNALYKSYETLYAPREWKELCYGLTIDQRFENAKNQIEELGAPTAQDFQQIVQKTLNSLNDYHVQVRLTNSGISLLPLSVAYVDEGDGKVIILDGLSALNINGLSDGDELVKISGVNCAHWVKLQAERESKGCIATDRALAAMSLVAKSSLWENLPTGKAELEIFSRKEGAVKIVELDWNYFPDLVKFSPERPNRYAPFKDALFLSPVAANAAKTVGNSLLKEPIGYRNTRVAPLGELLWSTPESSTFNAAMYRTPSGKKAGFLRIKTFMIEEENFSELERIIALFSRRTDYLVIDQMDNGGGNSFFLYGLLALLTDKPLTVPLHRLMLTAEDVLDAHISLLSFASSFEEFKAEFGLNQIYGMSVDEDWFNGFQAYYSAMITEWQEGNRLTKPINLSGFSQIKPHPYVRYTKPLYVLTNELDFSCADFFPVILQDNKRALIIGTKTAGAGGAITYQKFPSQFGLLATTFTSTIAHRENGEPFENLGVTPDIELKVSAEDLQDGYQHFRDELLKIVD